MGAIRMKLTQSVLIGATFRLARSLSLLALAVGVSSLLFSPVAAAQTQPLNDTGVTTCYSPNSLCDPALHKKQDAMVGRDAASRVAGSGVTTNTGKGFSFTKIARNGTPLPDNAVLGDNPTDWACTKDNVTGLTWEIKRDSPTASRYMNATYSWYDPNPATNGGRPGVENGGVCPVAGRCDIVKYIEDVRATGICGKTSQWRLPSVRELQNLFDFGTTRPQTFDLFFPNLPSVGVRSYVDPNWFMTGATLASNYEYFWAVQSTANSYWFQKYANTMGVIAVAP